MKKRDFELVYNNLRAFINNFGDVRIETNSIDKGFYVFYPADADSYIQYCPNIHYLDGWLYGVVQGVNRSEFPRNREKTYTQIKEVKGVFTND